MVFYTFIPILIEHSVSKKWKPDQTLRSAASGLGLHCFFSMSRKEDARINYFEMFFGGHVQSLKVIFHFSRQSRLLSSALSSTIVLRKPILVLQTYGPRKDCSIGSSPIGVHIFLFNDGIESEVHLIIYA